MVKRPKLPKHLDSKDDLVEPLTPGNGPPIALSEFLSLMTAMRDEANSLRIRIDAARRLLPYCHKLAPGQTVSYTRPQVH